MFVQKKLRRAAATRRKQQNMCRGMCGGQENTDLSCRCRWRPVRRWCPWRSPGWRFPWWLLSLWAYSSGFPGILASWHVWCPCSGPRPGSVEGTNSRQELTDEESWTYGQHVWDEKTQSVRQTKHGQSGADVPEEVVLYQLYTEKINSCTMTDVLMWHRFIFYLQRQELRSRRPFIHLYCKYNSLTETTVYL